MSLRKFVSSTVLFLPALGSGTPASVSQPVKNQEKLHAYLDESLTRKYLAFYSDESGQPHFLDALKRSEPYREIILDALREEGLPLELFYLPMVESDFNRDAISPAGAAGLWQLMPDSARIQGLLVTEKLDERFDPEKSTRAALRHLKAMHQMFGDWALALAAYNCGGGALQSVLARRSDLPIETRHYVPKFVAVLLMAQKLSQDCYMSGIIDGKQMIRQRAGLLHPFQINMTRFGWRMTSSGKYDPSEASRQERLGL
jgi:hypothetical protein